MITRRSALAASAAATAAVASTASLALTTVTASPAALTAIVQLNGQSFTFDEAQGRDLGDYVSAMGGFTQRCVRVDVTGCPLTVFFRPDRNSNRVEVVFELGRIFNVTTPANLGAYSVTITRGGATLAAIDVPAHYWYSRWRWQSSPRPIVGKIDSLISQGLLPPFDRSQATGGGALCTTAALDAAPTDLSGMNVLVASVAAASVDMDRVRPMLARLAGPRSRRASLLGGAAAAVALFGAGRAWAKVDASTYAKTYGKPATTSGSTGTTSSASGSAGTGSTGTTSGTTDTTSTASGSAGTGSTGTTSGTTGTGATTTAASSASTGSANTGTTSASAGATSTGATSTSGTTSTTGTAGGSAGTVAYPGPTVSNTGTSGDTTSTAGSSSPSPGPTTTASGSTTAGTGTTSGTTSTSAGTTSTGAPSISGTTSTTGTAGGSTGTAAYPGPTVSNTDPSGGTTSTAGSSSPSAGPTTTAGSTTAGTGTSGGTSGGTTTTSSGSTTSGATASGTTSTTSTTSTSTSKTGSGSTTTGNTSTNGGASSTSGNTTTGNSNHACVTTVLANYPGVMSTVTPYAVMGLASVTPYMPRTGERWDIGLVTEPQGQYICTEQAAPLAQLRADAEAAGTCPWHMRDENTNAPLNLRSYPRASCYENQWVCDPWIQLSSNPVTLDSAHMPALAFLPYMLTDDPYHLEDLQFMANWCLLALPPAYRPSIPQSRSFAWTLRSIAQAARVTPANAPSWLLPQTYWADMLQQNRAYLEASFVNSSNPVCATFRSTADMVNGRDEGPTAPGGTWIDPWQEEFLGSVIGWIVSMGFADWRASFDWKLGSTIARTGTTSGWIRAYATPYRIILRPSNTASVVGSWAEAWTLTAADRILTYTDPSSWVDGDMTYLAYSRGALVYANKLGTAGLTENITWATGQLNAKGWRTDYKWRLK